MAHHLFSGAVSPATDQDAFVMRFARPGGIGSIPSATGGIARIACARLDAIGKDAGPILAKAGVTPEEARDPAIRLEVRTQIRLLELAASELQDEWLGFHLARSFDLREIGLLYYVIASSEISTAEPARLA